MEVEDLDATVRCVGGFEARASCDLQCFFLNISVSWCLNSVNTRWTKQ
ncbi:hypothetical protein NC651_032889 [Populus alba x Populus x berolinensis]|nr:hypothetical protein NC651_032889 [Populus alba x Populus x berolinensis]